MSDAPALGTGSQLSFNCPLSPQRADRIVAALSAPRPATVLDLGCGWGELLLRVTAAVPEARAVGVDLHGADLARGRANAAERGLADRVDFVEGPAQQHSGTADLVLSVGAYQVFGDITQGLRALRGRVDPGGRLLFGAEFWQRPPSQAELAKMWPGITVDACLELPDLVDLATTNGFRPLDIQTATQGEWEEFESGLVVDAEQWLAANPAHPDAEATRAALDRQRSIWLRGHRDIMGFGYLILG